MDISPTDAAPRRRYRRLIAGLVIVAAIGVGGAVALWPTSPKTHFCTADQPLGLGKADFNHPPPGYTGSMDCWNEKVQGSIDLESDG